MAVPAYTEDLTDIDLAEVGSTGVAINFSGGGGGAPAAGIDLAMQGTNAWDRPVSTAERGIVFNQTPGAGVVAAGVHIYQWLFCGTPGLTDVLATRGAYAIAGTGTGALVQFHVEGNDTYGASGRVARCYPFRYLNTANTGSIPYRTLTGSPGATPTYFGAGLKTTAAAKGSNLGVDAVRYGTGAFLTAGELISAGDASDDPCTFQGFNTQNDAIANRWGILTKVGIGFELQGKFAMGQNNAGTATLCRFKDSDKSISIPDTVHSLTDFSQIIVDHASTRVEWTNINIEPLGTNNKGLINVINASSTWITEGGTFTNIGTTVLRAGCDFTGTTWRGTDSITINGATLTDCIIDNNIATSAVVATTLNDMTGCQFISDGTGHAVNLGTIASTQAMTWNNNDSGYAATDGSTGNETILVSVSASQTLTINVSATGSTPTIYNTGAGTVTVVAGQKNFKFTIKPSFTGYEWRIYSVTALGSLAGASELDGQESASVDNQTYSYTYTVDTPIAVQIIAVEEDYVESITFYTLKNADQEVTINLNTDTNN